jgi:hypothetical protein
LAVRVPARRLERHIQGSFDQAASDAAAQLWVGEGGVLTVIVLVVHQPGTMHVAPDPMCTPKPAAA